MFTTLASQVAPEKSSMLKKALQVATQRPWGYMVLDFDNAQEDALRFRTNLYPEEWPLVVFTGI